MDHFVTTYRRDYLWPYIRVMGERPSPENYYPPPTQVNQGNICTCHRFQRAIPQKSVGVIGPLASKNDTWSKLGPAAPLIDPKIYPAQVGRCPEVDTMRFNQPNVFLKKLQDKYPYIYEILRTAPPDDMISRLNKNRLRTTYQIDFSKMNEYPNAPYEELLRSAGVNGIAPCSEPVRLPGDPCRPNQRAIAFRVATVTTEGRTKSGTGSGAARGASSGRSEGISGLGYTVGAKDGSKCSGRLSGITPGLTEYQEAISKLGDLIIKDKIHFRVLKK